MEKTETILEKVGLTKQESRCYISLYNLKESKVGELAIKSNIATSNIYPVLDSLMKKGLASFKIVNNIRIYMPAPVEAFNNLIEERQRNLDEQKIKIGDAISQLKQVPLVSDSFDNYKFFSGIAGVKSMWLDILSYMGDIKRKETLKIYSSSKESSENLIAFYNDFQIKRKKLGHHYKIIMSNELPEHAKKRRAEGAEVKLIDLKSESSFGIFDSLFFISYNLGKNPIAFLIKDKKISEGFNEIFENVWVA